MLRATLRSLLARKLRLLLSATAVVLGVAFVSGALVLTDTLGRVFDDLFVSTSEKTDVEVRGTALFKGDAGTSREPVPAALVGRLRQVDGVAAATADVIGYAQLVGKDGTAYSTGGPPTFGQNFDAEPLLSPYTLRTGAAPAGPDEVAVDARTAQQTGYVVGDRVPVLLPEGQRVLLLTGVFGFGDNDNLGGASIAAFEQTTAQELFAEPGEVVSIRLAAQEGTDPETLRTAVAAVLPPELEALVGADAAQEQADEIKGFFGFFQTFLLVFAGVALFVGAFLIFNTFSILVAQRQRELALLRALGASRRQVTLSVLAESLLVGLVASALGLGLGVAVAVGLQALINAFGGALPSGPLVLATRTVVVSLVVGVVVTVAAALLPARRAAAVPPVAAMRDAVSPEKPLRRQSVVGAVLLIAGVVALVVGLEGQIALIGVGALLVFLGVAAVSPLLSRPVSRLVGTPLSRGVPGRLGRLNAMRNPRRTASTAAALMIGLALVTAVGVLGASAKASVESAVTASVGADVVVQGGGFQGFPSAVAEVLADAPGVAAVDRIRQDQAQVADTTTFLAAVAPEAIGRGLRLTAVEGELRLAPGVLLVGQGEAKARGLSAGDSVPVRLPRGGQRDYEVAGVYEDNELVGPYLLDLADAATGFSGPTDVALLLTAAEGVDTATLVATAEAATADYPTVEVLDQQGFVADAASRIDVVISIINVLLALSVLIAVLGIVNTLALAVLERTRELGLLRAVGLGRRQTRRMVTVEAVIVAVFGALLGIGVGSLLGIALQRALVDEGITDLRFPVSRLVLFVVVAALAGVVAALLPARRAARLDVLRAIATT